MHQYTDPAHMQTNSTVCRVVHAVTDLKTVCTSFIWSGVCEVGGFVFAITVIGEILVIHTIFMVVWLYAPFSISLQCIFFFITMVLLSVHVNVKHDKWIPDT